MSSTGPSLLGIPKKKSLYTTFPGRPNTSLTSHFLQNEKGKKGDWFHTWIIPKRYLDKKMYCLKRIWKMVGSGGGPKKTSKKSLLEDPVINVTI